MKILFVTEGYGATLFGVAQVVRRLVKQCGKAGVPVRLLASTVMESESENPVLKKIPVYHVGQRKSTVNRIFMIHHRMYSVISEEMEEFEPDVVHIHGVLSFVQVIATLVAAKRKTPVLISPHGMLEPWLWNQHGILRKQLKKLLWKLLLKPIIGKADYMHAITNQEALTLENEFPDIKQIHITNAIDVSEYSTRQYRPDEDKYLLFVGRLHPKKGVDLLIRAFNKAAVDDVRLIIAGPDSGYGYTNYLNCLIRELEMSDKVSLVGQKNGKEKTELLKRAWCTVVPSYSDVVALVNLESAASFTPTITTTMTGLSDWASGGGILVEPEIDSISEAIKASCSWSLENRMKKGIIARKFVEQRYSWEVMGPEWIAAYKMIAESGR